MHCFRAAAILFVSCFMSAVCTACTSISNPRAMPGSSPLDSINSLTLPLPSELAAREPGRTASTAGLTCEGDGFSGIIMPQHCLVTTPALEFTPGWDPANHPAFEQLAFAVYEFDTLALSTGLDVKTSWDTEPPAGELWYGVANFISNRWDWQPGLLAAAYTKVGAVADYRSLSGYTYVVVLTAGTDASILSQVVLSDGLLEIDVDYQPLARPLGNSAGLGGPILCENSHPAYIMQTDQGGGSFELWFMHATDELGASWDDPVDVDACSMNTPSLANTGSLPALAYVPAGQLWINYRRAQGAAGQTWGDPYVINSTNSPGYGRAICLFEANGLPAVVWTSFDVSLLGGGLMYIQCPDLLGTMWSYATAQALDPGYSSNESYEIPRAMVIGGKPAVAYLWQDTAGDPSDERGVRFVCARDADGADWNAPVAVFTELKSADSGLRNVDLVDLGGKPGIGWFKENYDNPASSQAYFVAATDTLGTAWNGPYLVYGPDSGASKAVSGTIWLIPFGEMRYATFQTCDMSAAGLGLQLMSMAYCVYPDQDAGVETTMTTVDPDLGLQWATPRRFRINLQETAFRGASASGKTASCVGSCDYFGILMAYAVGLPYDAVKYWGAMCGYDMSFLNPEGGFAAGTVPLDEEQ